MIRALESLYSMLTIRVKFAMETLEMNVFGQTDTEHSVPPDKVDNGQHGYHRH